METFTMINGNNQPYITGLPKLVILGHKWNDVALEHVFIETGLRFKINPSGHMEAQPENSQQIVKLFLTYDFKTSHWDNADVKNTMFLKSDHHIGFNVDSICYDCCIENHINVNGLKQSDRLAC